MKYCMIRRDNVLANSIDQSETARVIALSIQKVMCSEGRRSLIAAKRGQVSQFIPPQQVLSSQFADWPFSMSQQSSGKYRILNADQLPRGLLTQRRVVMSGRIVATLARNGPFDTQLCLCQSIDVPSPNLADYVNTFGLFFTFDNVNLTRVDPFAVEIDRTIIVKPRPFRTTDFAPFAFQPEYARPEN
jgi:hypothetical protein